MTVALSVSGTAASPDAVEAILRYARDRAAELEWAIEEVHHRYPHATLKHADGTTLPLESTEVRGVALIPHFACEGLPLLFLPDGTLVDGWVEDGAGSVPTLYTLALIKTHFAGPTAHEEVCAFLRELRAEGFPTLRVDDETGFFDDGNAEALRTRFREAWEELRARVDDPSRSPGDAFDVGDFPFIVPDPAAPTGEFDGVGSKTRETLENLAQEFVSAFGAWLMKTEPSRDDLLSLELLVDDHAARVTRHEDLEDADLQAFAHGAGALLGRWVAGSLGGQWHEDPEEGLALHNVGGSGLIVNPFRAVAERLAFKGPWNLLHQYDTWEALSRTFARRA